MFGNAQESFLFTVEKKTNKQTNTAAYVGNNLFTSIEEIIDSFFLWNQYKPYKVNNMKQFNESNHGFCGHCSGGITRQPYYTIDFCRYYLEIVML